MDIVRKTRRVCSAERTCFVVVGGLLLIAATLVTLCVVIVTRTKASGRASSISANDDNLTTANSPEMSTASTGGFGGESSIYPTDNSFPTTNSPEMSTPIGRVCSREDGYSLYTKGNLTVCLKFSTFTATQRNGSKMCGRDNAHLILIENSLMHSLVVGEMQRRGIDQLWVDGTDDREINVYESWKGEEIPWAPPGSNYNGQLSHCIRMVSLLGYSFQDRACDNVAYSYRYACQIEI